jgi:mono/diheme cytochrome c family protein
MKKILGLALVCISLSVVSCTKNSGSSGGPYVPTAVDATTKATLSDLQQGRTLFVNNCGACHALPNPDDYSTSGWNTILTSMAPRTALNSSQVTLVYKYVTRGQ